MLEVIPLPESYRPWLVELFTREWGSASIVTRGKVHNAVELPALLALWEDPPAGVVTYQIIGDACEVLTLNTVKGGCGAALTLLAAVKQIAMKEGCRRLWLITTNDNADAMKFFQKRGFQLKAVYPNAIVESRKLKPEIPRIGRHGIPIRDEIEMEMKL